MIILVLTITAAISAFFCIRSRYIESPVQLYIFKPLTTILIFFIALTAGWTFRSAYMYFILAGIILSLAGDIFLMLPSDQFISGLLSFLMAHLLFIAAFVISSGIGITWWLILMLGILSALISFILLPYAGKMKVPVLLYMFVIIIMAWQAWERWLSLQQTGALLAGIGSSLFLLSDFTLAINRFRKNFVSADLIVLSTYYLSLWFISLSVLYTFVH